MTAPPIEARRERNLLRLYFFVMWSGGAFLWPFISLFYARQNLNGMQIGVLVSIGSGVALLFAPLWGQWSDRSPHPARLLQIALVGTALISLVIGFHKVFLCLLLLTILNATLSCAVLPLSDSLALGIADRENYGSVRMWGSLGWAVAVLFAGWLIEKTTLLSGFYGFTTIFIGAALLLFLVPDERARNDQNDPAPGRAGSIKTLLGNRNLLALAGAVCVWYFIEGSFRNFEPLYLDQLGAGESVLGLLNTLRALAEIPAMLWADQLGRRRSPSLLIIVALIARGLACAAIVASPSVPVIVLVRTIDGLSGAFLYVGIVVFIGKYAPVGQRTFAITVITSTLVNLVLLLNGPVSGWIYETIGAYWLYVFSLGGYVVGLGVFMAIKNGKKGSMQSI
ncbi:MAG: MFS transporter [Anaerolineae bacterium]|nr:MFS transporter [Anaerolineae bacterium]